MQMVHKREGYRLDTWLERVAASDLAELQSFAAGVEKDKAAVKAGLTWSVNNAEARGTGDEIETPETHHVWESGISSSAPAGSPRRLTREHYLPP